MTTSSRGLKATAKFISMLRVDFFSRIAITNNARGPASYAGKRDDRQERQRDDSPLYVSEMNRDHQLALHSRSREKTQMR